MRRNGLSTPGLVLVNEDDHSDYAIPLPDGWGLKRVKASCSADCYRWAFKEYPALDWYGVISDDAIVRTPFERLIEARGRGFSTCNDLKKAPRRSGTAVVFDGGFVRAMGGIVPEGFHHLYVDDVWELIGRELGVWTYLPDVVVEHMHPAFGKSSVDVTYQEAWIKTERDKARFYAWLKEEKDQTLERIRKSL